MEYNNSSYGGKGKIRSRCDGYIAMFITFGRFQGIVSRAVDGTYNTATRLSETGSFFKKVTSLTKTHYWSKIYVDSNGDGAKEWIIIDCNTDCCNQYSTSKNSEND